MAGSTPEPPDETKAIATLLEQGFHTFVISALLHVDPRIVKNRCRSRTSVQTRAKFSRVPSISTLSRDGLKWREVGVLLGAYLTVAENPFESISAEALIAATKIYQKIHLEINSGCAQEHMLDANAAFSIAREYRDGTLKYVSCQGCRIKFSRLISAGNYPSPSKCPVCNTKSSK